MNFYSKKHLNTLFILLLSSTTLFADASKRRPINKILASVNDEIILESDLKDFKNKIKTKGYQELFGVADLDKIRDDKTALALMIEEKIINQQVKKLDISATDVEVEGQIRSIQKRNGITQAQLSEQLARLGTSIAIYKEGIRRQIERRNLMEREIKPTLETSDDRLRLFYLKNAKNEDKELQYKIAHILIEAKPGAKEAPQNRAQKIYDEVAKKPEDFDKLVKEYSDDSSSTETGGLIGTFSISSLSKEFKDVVPKVAVGQVSKPVKTAAGYHIIKVLEAKPGDFNNLSKDKKEALRNQMMGDEVENKMNLWLERKKGEAIVKKF